ncbi:MAG: hypothetical protein P8R42_25800 [Candidatus Binatia bacterium]|nr:hypothetical protein [Candidatus Binatia bacterium]
MESSLEKDLREWRENRGREMDAMAVSREQLFALPQVPSFNKGGRRVHVNGQEVVVVSKARRPLPS